MAYIFTDGGSTIVTYPYSIGLLRRDNPNVSFPPQPTYEQLADWNVFPIIATTPDGYDPLTQSRVEGMPVYVEGEWLQTWTVTDLSPEETTAVYDEFVTAAQIESGSLLDQADQYVVTALVRGQGLSPEFAAYRQALVDYQNLPGYPADVQYPTLPADIVVDDGIAPITYPLAGAVFNSGDVTFNNSSVDAVTTIVVPREAANAYDLSTALNALIETKSEAVLELNNLGDTLKKASFKVNTLVNEAIGTTEYTYRGFKSVYSRVYGDDPTITNIIFYPETVNGETLTPTDNDTDSEEFGLTGLSNGGTYAILNIYGQNDNYGIPAEEIKNAVLSFIDNVVYTGSLVSTPEEANTNFYTNYETIAATITSGLYGNLEDVDLSDNHINDGGDDQYDEGNYINTNYESEINYGNGEVVTDSTAFGVGSAYVSMFQDSMFAMFITGSDITELGITGERGADGDGEEEHSRIAFGFTPPTQEQIDAAPYTLTVSYFGGSADFSMTGAQVANLNYGRISKNQKLWNSPNNTTWKIVDVHGAKKLSYSPVRELSNNSYSYLGAGQTDITTRSTSTFIASSNPDNNLSYSISATGASDYVFDGPGYINTSDPVLTLSRGFTYTFVNNATSHPFAIRVAAGGASYTTGVSGSQTGTQVFTVPMDAPATLYYQCTLHGSMGNVINVVDSEFGPTETTIVKTTIDALEWLQSGVNYVDQLIIVEGQERTMTGPFVDNGDHVSISINAPVIYDVANPVLMFAVYDVASNNFQIPDDGSIDPGTIVYYKSQIEFNGEVRSVIGISQGDFGLGPAFNITFDGQGFIYSAGGSVNLSLWSAEVVEKWLDPEVDFGISPEELRGFSLDYHLYSEDAGTMIGKFIVAIDDRPRVTHMYSASGGGDINGIDIETYSNDWEDDKAFVFKRTDDEDDTIMIHWSGKAFYSPEWYD